MPYLYISIATLCLFALTFSPASQGLDPDFMTLFTSLFSVYVGLRMSQIPPRRLS